ncbi:MAG: hypothetical protein JSU90_07165 [Nitrospiraceae bacterium]|nr:MAG: hypothetical protein JSU90_07165 [Nitrospiraceae bacterium]
MENLTGKKVEVRTAETVYRGVLIEMGEREVHLRSDTGWIVIPLEKIVDIGAVD